MAAFAKNLLGLGSAPPLPTLAAPIAAPQVDTQAQSDAAARRQRRMGLSAAPKGGTLLTGPSGVETPATTQRATLLGGP